MVFFNGIGTRTHHSIHRSGRIFTNTTTLINYQQCVLSKAAPSQLMKWLNTTQREESRTSLCLIKVACNESPRRTRTKGAAEKRKSCTSIRSCPLGIAERCLEWTEQISATLRPERRALRLFTTKAVAQSNIFFMMTMGI